MTLSYTYDGAALAHDVAPTSLNLTQGAEGADPSYGGLLVEDPDADLELRGHRPFIVEESACSQPRLFTGWTTERGIGRAVEEGLFVGPDARAHDLTLIDLNALFSFRTISGSDGNRPEETIDARLAWILGSDYLAGLIESGYLLSSSIVMDAADYREQYPAAVLDDVASFWSGAAIYFAYWDTAASVAALWFGRIDDAISDSTLRISNDPTDIDSTVTFAPDPAASLSVTPTETYSEVTVKYGSSLEARLFRSRPSTATKYIRRGTSIDRPRTGKRTTASTQAENFLDAHANEQDRITVTIILPAASVGLITAGQRMDVKFTHLTSYVTFTSMRVVRTNIRPTDDLARFYSMELELLAPRPAGSFVNPCSGGTYPVTASGTFPPLNSDTTPAGSIVYKTRTGLLNPGVPTPGHTGNWAFQTNGSGGSPDYGETAYWNPNNQAARFIVVGAGTLVVTAWASGDSGVQDCSLTVFHSDPGIGPVEDNHVDGDTTAPLSIDVSNSDGFCVKWVDLQIKSGVTLTSHVFGFAGATWTSVGDAPDTEADLPPAPFATTVHTTDPTITDDTTAGYHVGATWINSTTGEVFVLTDDTAGAAVWVSTTASGTTNAELNIEGGQSVIKPHGAAGATETIDPSDGNVHSLTLDSDLALTLAAPTGSGACTLELRLTQDGTGGWDITWPGSVTLVGTLDTTAGTTSIVILETLDGGTSWVAVVVGGGGGGTPATTVTDETSWGITPDVGTDTEYARQDHTHGSPSDPGTASGRWELAVIAGSPPDPLYADGDFLYIFVP